MEFNYTKVSIEEKRCINKKVHLAYSNRIFKFKNVKIEILRNLIHVIKCTKILFFFLFFIMLKVTFSYDSGVTQVIYKDEVRKREFVTMVFYPTILGENDKLEIIGENPIFTGNKFKKNSKIASGEFSLIFLIHGSGGNNTSMGYLAKELVSRGIIVVAANHLSDKDGDSPAETISIKPWVQNEDISFLLDSVLKDSRFNKNILLDSIGVIGYSKGAYSALALAGGKLKLSQYENYCTSKPNMPDCVFYNDNIFKEKINFEKSYLDKRFSFIVSIDPIFSLSFDSESLKKIKIPILLISSEYYSLEDTNINLYGKSIYKYLDNKKSRYKLIKNSGHFDFLPLCKKEAVEILKTEGEGEEIICMSGERDRKEIHDETVKKTLKFLYDINIIKTKN